MKVTDSKRPGSPAEAAPVLLSGGNPQIAKGTGDAVARAYLDAMPDWKRDTGRRLDALIRDVIPNAAVAVKWNSPFYGVEQGHWFASFHCFTRYVKVTFFDGETLRPQPPETSRHAGIGYLHVFEAPPLDETTFRDWVRQAVELPGTRM